MDYEKIICFETHVELKTKTKLFCDCLVKYDALPNSHVCPVCTGQPGALPVLNKRAVEFAIRAGAALNCRVNTISRFARKNYFYPDLPKGYQISQYERPFCENGSLEIVGDNEGSYLVGIKRIHLEEDAGKLVHSSDSFDEAEYSLIDYNRSSVPLLEIVMDHEQNPLHSVHEARNYLEKLRQILKYVGISDCKLEKGQFRCDVNVSLRPNGSSDFGNRTEVKNMSSFRFIMDAITYEIERQKDILDSGGEVEQETRLFDEEKKITVSMRSKEDAPDYRYFPDPDLVEVEIEKEFLREIERSMPELPDERVNRIIDQYEIPKNEALILTKDRNVIDFLENCIPHCKNAKKLSAWIIKDLFKLLNENSIAIDDCPIPPVDFSSLINLIADAEITDSIGRIVLEEMFTEGGKPETIIESKGLRPIQDKATLEKILEEVLTENPQAVSEIKQGMSKPVDFLVGQIMKKTKGKANPIKARELIEKKLTK